MISPKAPLRIVVCFLAIGSGCASGLTPQSEVPPAVGKAMAELQAASKLPIDQHQQLVNGYTVDVVSRDAALKGFLEKHEQELLQAAAGLKRIADAGGPWSVDAAVILGFLYSFTGADVLWAPAAALRQFQKLAEWNGPLRLKSWTREELRSIPAIGYGWNEDGLQNGADESVHVVAYFARQLVARVLVTEGPAAAGRRVAQLRRSSVVAPAVLADLEHMIRTYESLNEKMPRGEEKRP